MTKFEPVGYLPTGEELWPYKDGTIVLPSPPPDDAPELVREGLARQRVARLTGRCPCGAAAGEAVKGDAGVYRRKVSHIGACPASGRQLRQRVVAWQSSI
jgi:hypothetical protein